MTQKETYQQKIEEQLREWGAKIDTLRAEAERLEISVRERYFEQVDELKAKQEIAKIKLQALRESGIEAWEELKTGVEKATAELRQGIENAHSRFNQRSA